MYQGGFALVPTVILIQFESRGPEHHLICLSFPKHSTKTCPLRKLLGLLAPKRSLERSIGISSEAFRLLNLVTRQVNPGKFGHTTKQHWIVLRTILII